ncbi:MAG: DUF5104 domain-containing protein, partial [Oscillospiraceae bacterium]|nr:DUF5104 domain-containing protein [Oscillospiraceae bacterium]
RNKEKEPIKELFCENAKNTINLDRKLDDFLGFIDGNIVSYDSPCEGDGGYSSTEKGLVEKHLSGYIGNILTDTGNVYSISAYFSYIYKEDPGFVGMIVLAIQDENRYNSEHNYPEDAFYFIKINYPGVN